MALDDPSTSGNPKKLSEDDMKVMYQHSMSGTLLMANLNILIVEGNDPKNNEVFVKFAKASCLKT